MPPGDVRRVLDCPACHGRALARGCALLVQKREAPQRVEARLESRGVRALHRPTDLLDAPFAALQSTVNLRHIRLTNYEGDALQREVGHRRQLDTHLLHGAELVEPAVLPHATE